MKKINVHEVYEFATAIRPVTAWQDEIEFGEIYGDLSRAQRAISRLVQDRQPVAVRTALASAIKLQQELDKIHNEYAGKDDENFFEALVKKVYGWQLSRPRDAAKTFEIVFRAEMEGAPVYSVDKKFSYDVSELVESFDSSFPAELVHVIGAKALAEFRAAGRCHAFGLASAAGFHACRAVEAVLHEYCDAYSSNADSCRSWHDYIKCLRDTTLPNKPNDRTVGHLDLMRKTDRNPIMHPRIVLTETDADALLGLSKAAIIFMAQEMAEQNGQGKQLRLLEGGAAETNP